MHGFSSLLRSQIAGAECPRFSISQYPDGARTTPGERESGQVAQCPSGESGGKEPSETGFERPAFDPPSTVAGLAADRPAARSTSGISCAERRRNRTFQTLGLTGPTDSQDVYARRHRPVAYFRGRIDRESS